VLVLRQIGYSFNTIKDRLKQENIVITSRSLQQLEKKFFEHGTYKDLARRKRCKKLSQVMVDCMNDKLTEDDKLTSTKLHKLLLMPFIQSCYPDGHRFQQDNDPKHTNRHIENYFESRQINWWRTPPESPDLNPIENVWGTLKQYLRNTYKPRNMTELKARIERFWQSLTAEVCKQYINHLNKVVLKVIEVDGNPSGY